jgi:hypothetical protein
MRPPSYPTEYTIRQYIQYFSTPGVEYKHSDSGFRYGVTHILELLQNIIPLCTCYRIIVGGDIYRYYCSTIFISPIK